MQIEYFYCTSCGYEDNNDVDVAYSRTCASGDIYLCPECNEEVLAEG